MDWPTDRPTDGPIDKQLENTWKWTQSSPKYLNKVTKITINCYVCPSAGWLVTHESLKYMIVNAIKSRTSRQSNEYLYMQCATKSNKISLYIIIVYREKSQAKRSFFLFLKNRSFPHFFYGIWEWKPLRAVGVRLLLCQGYVRSFGQVWLLQRI